MSAHHLSRRYTGPTASYLGTYLQKVSWWHDPEGCTVPWPWPWPWSWLRLDLTVHK